MLAVFEVQIKSCCMKLSLGACPAEALSSQRCCLWLLAAGSLRIIFWICHLGKRGISWGMGKCFAEGRPQGFGIMASSAFAARSSSCQACSLHFAGEFQSLISGHKHEGAGLLPPLRVCEGMLTISRRRHRL